eukprot:m.7643 g.7643  ORF g.7643 m.7643 type:complete len:405 (+) comp3001_c0_seq2:45-1259(+)
MCAAFVCRQGVRVLLCQPLNRFAQRSVPALTNSASRAHRTRVAVFHSASPNLRTLNTANMPIEEKPFGTLPSGEAVTLYKLSNAKGTTVDVMTYGAAITSLRTADKAGDFADIVLGFADLEGYTKAHPYFGVVAGRVANRIAKGKFTLEGKEYQLAVNNGPNSLHGGLVGFDKVNWQAAVKDDKVVLTYLSKDGEEGYPGNLTVSVSYQLTDDNKLVLHYSGTTDATTVVNVTNHSYFNLAGAGSGDVKEHVVQAPVEQFTPVNDELIPTGELASVKGTPFDFSEPVAIGKGLLQADSNGYDHNLVINRKGVKDGELAHALTVSEPKSGRTISVRSTEPGIQFYCGGFLNGEVGREGKAYPQFGGFCLETQKFPDAINQPTFPSIVLKPGETLSSTTEFAFGTE